MVYLVTVLLLLAAHLSLTAFAPADAGKAWVGWPFAANSRSWLRALGGLPKESGSIVTALLAGIAGLAFVAAAVGLFGVLVPAEWWPAVVLVGVGASALLHALYFRAPSILPLAVDALLLYVVLALQWSAGPR
jgi:hypothetical protein